MLDRILNYFADVAASIDVHFSPHVGDVVFLNRNMLNELRVMGDETFPALKRISAADQLHTDEHLLHDGRFWIIGNIDGIDYRWPMVRRRVSAKPGLGKVHVSRIPRSDWEPSPGLVTRDALDPLEIESDFLGSFVEPTTTQVTGNYPRLKRLTSRYLAAAGLPPLKIITSFGNKINVADNDPHLLTASGLYLERHPFELNHASALKLWATQPLEQSALPALYSTPASSSDTGQASTDIQSPLPLNASQRAAVVSSRSDRITVVAGPPGTGKSHLVAATAIDRVATGHSVLIASQSIHACDVVYQLLQRYPMLEALRFGDSISARRLGDLLAAGVPAPDTTYDPDRLYADACGLVDQINDLSDQIGSYIEGVDAFDHAVLHRDDVPLWVAQRDLRGIDVDRLRRAAGVLRTAGRTRLLARREAVRDIEHGLGRMPASLDDLDDILDKIHAHQLVDEARTRTQHLDELWDELERVEEGWRHTIGDLLEARRRLQVDRQDRTALHELASVLRLDATNRRAGLAKLGGRFLQAVPLWIGTLDEIESILPVHPGLFDLVILDEASQISQLASVPALARGRHALIVGDSHQLRHTSTVSAQAHAHAAEHNNIKDSLAARLDDRTNSTFDSATAVAPTIFLDEHYRSTPHIIGFSNRLFYNGRLRLMTQHPRNEARDAIGVLTVPGERDRRGVVQQEVAAVMQRVATLIEHGVKSIGVISPFDSQALAIEEAIISMLTLEQIEHHQLRVGTVHSFQGSERDYVIISTGIGVDDQLALQRIEDPAAFNVMVTRARTNIDVITTFDRSTAGPGFLGQYLRHADEPPMLRDAHVQASGWTARIASEISNNTSHRVITSYRVAGESIDIVVGAGPHAFALETEVHPHGQYAHIERHLALRRAGWDIRSFYRPTHYGNEEEGIARLLAQLSKHPTGTLRVN